MSLGRGLSTDAHVQDVAHAVVRSSAVVAGDTVRRTTEPIARPFPAPITGVPDRSVDFTSVGKPWTPHVSPTQLLRIMFCVSEPSSVTMPAPLLPHDVVLDKAVVRIVDGDPPFLAARRRAAYDVAAHDELIRVGREGTGVVVKMQRVPPDRVARPERLKCCSPHVAYFNASHFHGRLVRETRCVRAHRSGWPIGSSYPGSGWRHAADAGRAPDGQTQRLPHVTLVDDLRRDRADVATNLVRLVIGCRLM